MIVLTKGVSNQSMILTLSEMRVDTLSDCLIVFTNITTNDSVSITLGNGDDTSIYPDRYNKYLINISLFSNVPSGQYNYEAFEVNTNTLLETGRLLLQPSVNIIRDGYTTETTIKGYAG